MVRHDQEQGMYPALLCQRVAVSRFQLVYRHFLHILRQ